ncbi:MAG: hypothetical protein IJT65_01730 [Eubacterium sp.]|nr:hypothetical protein [Eubacterium sp.]
MIEKIDNPEILLEWDLRDIYSVRILALLKSYGCKYHFCSFYRQVIDGKTTAVLSKLDKDVTLALKEGFDAEELIHFLCVTGYDSLLCDECFELGADYTEGFVMKCNTKRDAIIQGAYVDEYPKLMDLFNFVDYSSGDFKAWYVDLSHRVRHKTAKAYTLNIDDEIISSGILSSIIKDYSILTAVRTKEEFRGMGYGSFLIKYIYSDVNGTVYIMRDRDLNESFYLNLGFENIGKWRMYK